MGEAFVIGGYDAWQWLEIVQREFLLFAAVFFLIGTLDELLVDLMWLRLRLTGRAAAEPFHGAEDAPLAGPAAVLVPAWREADVIGAMLRHTRTSWPQAGLRVYAGCYRNDPATLAALVGGAERDARIRIVIHDRPGPTTKADCLNRLYAALLADERRTGIAARCVILHDAEDMVHPAALALIDQALADTEFVQLPVLPVPQPRSPWIAGHYGDEFAEAHGKTLVVRAALGAGLPVAGVGCGFAREALGSLAASTGSAEAPFAAECLTEDYELGLKIAERGGRGRFIRACASDGSLIATRELFPDELGAAVRQKTRWLHGIAFQGWDRLGWSGRWPDLWMRLRDRRGPLTALVLAAAYAVMLLWAVLLVADLAGWHDPAPLGPGLTALLWINSASFLWRATFRFAFASQNYGWVEGVRSIPRIVVANIIAIMAGRRALAAYLRSLLSGQVLWEKTVHRQHASLLARSRLPSFAR
jgi:adsorption protein B